MDISAMPALRDNGGQPYIVDLRQAVTQNDNFRLALWTGEHLQMTLMSIKIGESIGLERHPNLDQFVFLADGRALVKMGDSRENMSISRMISGHTGIFIPAGTWHNLINMGLTPLKLYSIYAPPQHPFGTVQKNKPAED